MTLLLRCISNRFWVALLLGTLFISHSIPAGAQAQEIEQLALDIQKLEQLKKVLQTMYQSYEVLYSGYEKVKNLTEGNFSLHQTFLDGLLLVSPRIRKYKRVADIIRDESHILTEYKNAIKKFRAKDLFSPEERQYMAGVYGNLMKQAAWNLDELAMIITSGQLRMSDAERLSAIDRIYRDTRQKLGFLRRFNHMSATLAAQRTKHKQDVLQMRNLMGIHLEKSKNN